MDRDYQVLPRRINIALIEISERFSGRLMDRISDPAIPDGGLLCRADLMIGLYRTASILPSGAHHT